MARQLLKDLPSTQQQLHSFGYYAFQVTSFLTWLSAIMANISGKRIVNFVMMPLSESINMIIYHCNKCYQLHLTCRLSCSWERVGFHTSCLLWSHQISVFPAFLLWFGTGSSDRIFLRSGLLLYLLDQFSSKLSYTAQCTLVHLIDGLRGPSERVIYCSFVCAPTEIYGEIPDCEVKSMVSYMGLCQSQLVVAKAQSLEHVLS